MFLRFVTFYIFLTFFIENKTNVYWKLHQKLWSSFETTETN